MIIEKVRLTSNPNKKLHKKIEGIIEDFFSKHHIEVIKNDKPLEDEDLVIALGGDGTILRAAREIKNPDTPILGVNLGNLGFLTDIPAENVNQCLEKIISGQVYFERRIKLTIGGDSDALNDIVIQTSSSFRVVQMLVYINGHFFSEIIGDGIIISTPTGSTAYSLSAGGPIVYPTMDIILVNTISPHMLSLRPLLVTGDSEIMIQLCSDRAIIVIDGQIGKEMIKGDKIIVKKSIKSLKLMKLKGSDYFSTLRNKLKLGDLKAKRTCENCPSKAECLYPTMPT